MAAEKVQDLGEVGASSAGTTLALVLSGLAQPVAVGNHILIMAVGGGALPISATDDAGPSNTYQVDHQTADTDPRGALISAKVTTELQNGDTITLTWAASTATRAFAAQEVSSLDGTDWFDVATSAAGTGTASDSGLTATSEQANNYAFGGTVTSAITNYAFETLSPTWTLDAEVESTGTVRGVHMGHRVVTDGPTQYDALATWTTSRAWKGLIGVYKEAAAAGDEGYLVQESDGTSQFTLEDGSGSIILEGTVPGGSLVDRTVADAVAYADAVVRLFVGARAVSDSRGQSDAVTRLFAGARTASDAVTHSDAATRIGAFLRSTADAVTFADVATASKTFIRTVTDSLTSSDAATRAVVLARTVSQSLTQSDAVTRVGTFLRTVADASTRADAATTTKSIFRTAADALSSSVAATRAVALVRTAAESVSFSAVAVAVKEGAGTIGEAAIQFIESMAAALGRIVSHTATFTITARHEAALVTEAVEYDLSDTTNPTVTFTVDGTATDPTTITLTVRSPDGTTTNYTYGAAQITKDATGVYHKQISLTQRGVWWFRFVGTGSCEAAAEGTVTVRL